MSKDSYNYFPLRVCLIQNTNITDCHRSDSPTFFDYNVDCAKQILPVLKPLSPTVLRLSLGSTHKCGFSSMSHYRQRLPIHRGSRALVAICWWIAIFNNCHGCPTWLLVRIIILGYRLQFCPHHKQSTHSYTCIQEQLIR